MAERDGTQLLHLLRESRSDLSYCELSDEEEDHVETEYEEDDQQDADESTDFDQRTERISDEEDIKPELEPQRNRSRRSFINGKNNFRWSLNAPETQGRSSTKVYQPSAKFEAKDVTTPLEAWSLLFSPNILEIILQHTNEEIERKRENYSHQTYYGNTNVIELKAFLGLLYFSGFEKNNHSNIEDMWSSRFGSNLYRTVMTQHRFTFLLTCLRFDDKDTRAERRAVHALAPIKEIWDLFIENCAKYYSPSTNCTIDEQLLGFRGHFGARVYIPSRSDKYGIKIVSLNDAQTSYMVNAEPYVGRVATNGSESVPSYYIRKLSEPLYNSGRNITCDNWFTSVEIVQDMKKKYSLTMVGTLRKSKREIPVSFTHTASAGTVRFAYANDNTLVSYCPKRNKVILLLSSLHKTGRIDKESGKPEIASFYISTKGSTNTFEKLCKTYSTARITQSWSLRLFFGMLDQAGVNSVILFNLRTANSPLNRRGFLKQLLFALIQPHLQSRAQNQNLPRNIRNMIHEMLGIKEAPRERVDKLEKRKRCSFCTWKNDKKTMYCCALCAKPVCEEHRTHYCKDCAV